MQQNRTGAPVPPKSRCCSLKHGNGQSRRPDAEHESRQTGGGRRFALNPRHMTIMAKPSCRAGVLYRAQRYALGLPEAQAGNTVTVHSIAVPRARAIFTRDYKLICPTWQETYFALLADFPLNPSGKSKVNSRHPVPPEGRRPSSRTLGQVAVDAAASGA